MKVGVIGSGIVGQVLAAGFLKHGHQAMLGTRDPQKPDVQKWVAETPGSRAGTFAEAATFGELIVLATSGKVAENALELAGPDNLTGKTIIDACNPIADTPPQEGVLAYFTDLTNRWASGFRPRCRRRMWSKRSIVWGMG